MKLSAVTHLPAIPGVWHEFAGLFPMLDAAGAEALAADIAEHGVREPIVQFEGKILDGRNRYMAARAHGVSVPVVQFEGIRSEALAYVLSVNLHRRHLTDSQRATIAARIANMSAGDNQHSRGTANLTDLPASEKTDPPQQHTDDAAIEQVSEPPNAVPLAVSQADAARMLNVPARRVRTAKAMLDHGAPELVAAVEKGEVSVSAAAAVADLPPEEQVAVVADGPKAVKAKAKAIRDRKAAPADTKDSVPVDPERRKLAKLTTDALIDDVIGLRAENADLRTKNKALKAEIETLKGDLAAFKQDDLGRSLGNALRQARIAEGRMQEYQATAVRSDRKLKAVEAENKRLKAELENQVVPL